MKKKNIFWIIVACVTIVLYTVTVSYKSLVNTENDPNQIIGVWKYEQDIKAYLQNSSYVNINYPASSSESNQARIKIITKDRFVWIQTFNDRIVGAFGGTYTFDGTTYTEYIKYGTPNMDNLGQKSVFEVKFEADRMYIHGGNEQGTFDEVWKRIE